jgi:hypothetical protein
VGVGVGAGEGDGESLPPQPAMPIAARAQSARKAARRGSSSVAGVFLFMSGA